MALINSSKIRRFPKVLFLVSGSCPVEWSSTSYQAYELGQMDRCRWTSPSPIKEVICKFQRGPLHSDSLGIRKSCPNPPPPPNIPSTCTIYTYTQTSMSFVLGLLRDRSISAKPTKKDTYVLKPAMRIGSPGTYLAQDTPEGKQKRSRHEKAMHRFLLALNATARYGQFHGGIAAQYT